MGPGRAAGGTEHIEWTHRVAAVGSTAEREVAERSGRLQTQAHQRQGPQARPAVQPGPRGWSVRGVRHEEARSSRGAIPGLGPSASTGSVSRAGRSARVADRLAVSERTDARRERRGHRWTGLLDRAPRCEGRDQHARAPGRGVHGGGKRGGRALHRDRSARAGSGRCCFDEGGRERGWEGGWQGQLQVDPAVPHQRWTHHVRGRRSSPGHRPQAWPGAAAVAGSVPVARSAAFAQPEPLALPDASSPSSARPRPLTGPLARPLAVPRTFAPALAHPGSLADPGSLRRPRRRRRPDRRVHPDRHPRPGRRRQGELAMAALRGAGRIRTRDTRVCEEDGTLRVVLVGMLREDRPEHLGR